MRMMAQWWYEVQTERKPSLRTSVLRGSPSRAHELPDPLSSSERGSQSAPILIVLSDVSSRHPTSMHLFCLVIAVVLGLGATEKLDIIANAMPTGRMILLNVIFIVGE